MNNQDIPQSGHLWLESYEPSQPLRLNAPTAKVSFYLLSQRSSARPLRQQWLLLLVLLSLVDIFVATAPLQVVSYDHRDEEGMVKGLLKHFPQLEGKASQGSSQNPLTPRSPNS